LIRNEFFQQRQRQEKYQQDIERMQQQVVEQEDSRLLTKGLVFRPPG